MDERDLLLIDMLTICRRLVAIRDRLSLDAVDADPDHVWTISYGFLALGEATARLERLDPGYLSRVVSPDIHWSDVIGTRNVIAHGYDIVDPKTLWGFLQREIPQMLGALEPVAPRLNDDKDTP